MGARDCSLPIVIRNGAAKALRKISFNERAFDENWLQKLLFENPTLLPFAEIEPAFSGSISVVRELPTGAGPVDILCMNSNGYISLIETKLWRNPESRRSVVAQIIDYATEMTKWAYDDLIAKIGSAGLKSSKGDPLIELFKRPEDEEFDVQMFTDRVARNLMKGRFLLLIVGDGIQEGVEKMAEFLQSTPSLGYTLGLVEMGVYRENPDDNENLFIQPRIVARTREIVRAVVEIKVPIKPTEITVTLPFTENEKKSVGRRRITEEAFLEALAKNSPVEVVELARWVLDSAAEHELRIDWRDAGPVLKYDDPMTGEFFTVGQLHKDGLLSSTGYLASRFKKLGWPLDACHVYFEEVVALIPKAKHKVTRYKDRDWDRIGFGDSPSSEPPLAPLAAHKEEWFAAIDRLIQKIKVLAEKES